MTYEINAVRFSNSLFSFMWDDDDIVCRSDDVLYTIHPHLVFEGAQGLLLDEHTGQFPYVTRSNTGLTNVVKLAPVDEALNVWYVTRAYLTRHGAGPMVGEDSSVGDGVVDLTNKPNDWQGSLRFAPLDPYAVLANICRDVNACGRQVVVNVVVTCCDQVDSSVVTQLNSVFMASGMVNAVWNCSDPTGKTLKNVM
jgi:adenylosuccinate synthase